MSDYSNYQLLTAVKNRDARLVATILQQTPSLADQPDERGFLPIVLASYAGDLPTTKALIDGGADVNANLGTGTALMGVAFKGNEELVRFLLENGADKTATNQAGQTAAAFAAMGGHHALADLLS
ncbi:ankyrin repeat domain-containing protein [Lewinella sp. 4G2]|uniref:ankyrin repeat domain-containing protein n=1 Tax=Lewinella sp. 4G2 TaxID=1803372 RepID=UPI0007B4A32D|nr:ankyrin repeat domain-containing protein [Lewinella sp. 4G2]OAV44669.1 hypothetical protein A3850_009270 [Lewinella sp. 4G2]